MSWIKTNAFFRGDSYSDEIFESLTEEQKADIAEPTPFRFLTEEVISYNEASNGFSTIRLKNNYSIIVEMRIHELDKIFIDNK